MLDTSDCEEKKIGIHTCLYDIETPFSKETVRRSFGVGGKYWLKTGLTSATTAAEAVMGIRIANSDREETELGGILNCQQRQNHSSIQFIINR